MAVRRAQERKKQAQEDELLKDRRDSQHQGVLDAFAHTAQRNDEDEDASRRGAARNEAEISMMYGEASRRGAEELNGIGLGGFAGAVAVGTVTAAVDLTTSVVKGGLNAGASGVKAMAAGAKGTAAAASSVANTGIWAMKNPTQAGKSTVAGIMNAPANAKKGATTAASALGGMGADARRKSGLAAFGGAGSKIGGGSMLSKFKAAGQLVEQENVKAKKQGLARWIPGSAKEAENKAARALRDMLIYLIFMGFYIAVTMRGLNDTHAFYMTEAVRGQFIGVEMTDNYVPNFAKTWEGISSVEEWYTWLDSAFKHTVFSPATFDGGVRHTGATPRLHFRKGYALSFNKIVGTVRIGQARVRKTACAKDQVPDELKWGTSSTSAHNYSCFGNLETSGAWDRDFEDTAAYGNFTAPRTNLSTTFRYDGIVGATGAPLPAGTVQSLRGQDGQVWSSSQTGLKYDTPSHWVLLDPTQGVAENGAAIGAFFDSGYVDLHTRALVVDLTVYNPQLERMLNVRLVAEVLAGGGMVPNHEFHSMRIYASHTAEDRKEFWMAIVVGLFYLYYSAEEAIELWHDGPRTYFSSTLNCAMVLNILLFVLQVYYRALSSSNAPALAYVDAGDSFIDFRAAMQATRFSNDIGAINTFLNWFKMIAYLSYIPTFALLTDTLKVAAPEIFGFSFVFAIVFFGFAQAHTMVFGGRVEGYRTLGNSMYMLTRSLLGDFDFEEMRRNEPTIGPLFFVLFICLAVFVILNMLIAIVSDAYSTCRELMKKKKKVDIVAEMSVYIRDTVESIPFLGPRIKQARLMAEKMAHKAKEMADKAAASAAAAGKAGAHGMRRPSFSGHMRRPSFSGHTPNFLRKSRKQAKGTIIASGEGEDQKTQVAIDHDADGKMDAVLELKTSVKLTKTPKNAMKQVYGVEIDDENGEGDLVAFNASGHTTGVDTVLKVNKEGLDHALGKSLKAELVSTHHDGHSNLIAIDTSGTGEADTVLRVDDSEGAYGRLTAEQIEHGQRLDLDDDDIADMICVDTTGDGHLDTVVAINHDKLMSAAKLGEDMLDKRKVKVERRVSLQLNDHLAQDRATKATMQAAQGKGLEAPLILRPHAPIEGSSVVDMALLESACAMMSVMNMGVQGSEEAYEAILAYAREALVPSRQKRGSFAALPALPAIVGSPAKPLCVPTEL